MTILLVEDNPADARLTVEAFGDSRDVDVCVDGETALEQLRDSSRRRPDLILLDLNLPGLDGREVLHEIKSDPTLATIPVCVLTTSRAENDVAEAYAKHTNAYIVKPFDLAEFRRMVEQINAFWFGVVHLPDRKAS
jgi:two-component system, chemotaxis family, response regulator Rcp1